MVRMVGGLVNRVNIVEKSKSEKIITLMIMTQVSTTKSKLNCSIITAGLQPPAQSERRQTEGS